MTVAMSTLGAVALGGEDAARAVAAVKAQLRSGSDAEDALIEGHCRASLGLAERFIGSVAIAREMRAVLPATPGWRLLPGGPVRAITAVEALAADGSASVMPADGYCIDIDAAGDGWVRVTAVAAARVRVTYQAGLAPDWDTLPPPIAQGVVLLAAHFLDGRGADAPPPGAVAALWRPWRRMRLNQERRA